MDSLKGFRDPERAYGQHFENHRTTKRTLTGEGKKSDHTRSSTLHYIHGASPVVQRVKCLPAMQETQVQSLGWEDPLEKAMATHSSTLAWKIPWRSLVGYSPWGRRESDTTEWLHFHFSLSCIGEGNGNPLQCSCLENPRDRGAWWAAIYGVAQSRTRLMHLSNSSRIHPT